MLRINYHSDPLFIQHHHGIILCVHIPAELLIFEQQAATDLAEADLNQLELTSVGLNHYSVLLA